MDDPSDASESNSGWISWFCELEGHEFFAEVIIIRLIIDLRSMKTILETLLTYTVLSNLFQNMSKFYILIILS
jgi:hypothetical protein